MAILPTASAQPTSLERLVEYVPKSVLETDQMVSMAVDSLAGMEQAMKRLAEYIYYEFAGAHREGETFDATAIRLLEQLKRLRDRGNGDRVVLAEEHDSVVRRLKGHIARVRDAG